MKLYKIRWTAKNMPLVMVEMIYRGDVVERQKLFGHKFDGHYWGWFQEYLLLFS